MSEVLLSLDEREPDDIIYAPDGSDVDLSTEVLVVSFHQSKLGSPAGFHYLLEIGVTRDVINGLAAELGAVPSPKQQLAAMKFYAEHDAYIDPSELP